MAPQSSKKDNEKLKTISIYGLVSTVQFQKAKCCAEDLYKKRPDLFKSPVLHSMLEFEWADWLARKKEEERGELWAFNDLVMIFIDETIIGNLDHFVQWSVEKFNFEDFRNDNLYETLRKEAYAEHLQNSKNDFVYMDFEYDNEKLGRIIIELFKNVLPKTCENFKTLCTGEKGRAEHTSTKLHYKNTIINRIVQNGWIQGGDLVSGKGNSSESIYGGHFEDESFALLHDKRGIVGMANVGRHTNGSQFYITLQPAPWMDKKYVAFGRVVEGSETLKRIEKINTLNQRPTKECKIEDSGTYTFEF